jgi:hypothetical protein
MKKEYSLNYVNGGIKKSLKIIFCMRNIMIVL